jgi:hypothetical protein
LERRRNPPLDSNKEAGYGFACNPPYDLPSGLPETPAGKNVPTGILSGRFITVFPLFTR